MPAHASIDVFGVWTHWTQHVCRRGCSAVIHYQRCFAGTFKVRIFKAAVPFCTTMTFRSLKWFVNIKMWDTFTLSTEWYRSFAVKVRSAFLISIPSAFVLHRDIKASSKCAHSRPVLLNKPPPPAVRRLPQFPSATGQLQYVPFLSQFNEWWGAALEREVALACTLPAPPQQWPANAALWAGWDSWDRARLGSSHKTSLHCVDIIFLLPLKLRSNYFI